jgi:hypothetical protein
VREREVAGGVVKLTFVVALDTSYGTTKLCGHINKKVKRWGTCQTHGAAEKSTSNEYNHPK